jgi:peptidoglycan/LPS O-acetylase OafA/YrhL
VAFITASVLIFVSHYCNAISQPDNSRFSQLDGLRGYLALGVFITHAASMRQMQEVGRWGFPPSSFFIMAGTIPVSLFFMITGFLFWGKTIKAQGEIKPYGLLGARLRRLAPLYLSTIPVLLFFVGIQSHWTLRTDISSLLIAAGRWSLVGLGGHPTINGVAPLYPQVWTLSFEWAFYAALPLIAFLWRPTGSIAIIATLILITVTSATLSLEPPQLVLNFAIGIAIAALISVQLEMRWLKTWWAALAALSILALPSITGNIDYGWKTIVCVAPLFACVCYGNSIFGLLSNRAARLLGMVSYSTYLIHAFMLQLMVLVVGHFAKVGALAADFYWPMLFALTVLVVAASVLTFRFIEQPWIRETRRGSPTHDGGSPRHNEISDKS